MFTRTLAASLVAVLLATPLAAQQPAATAPSAAAPDSAAQVIAEMRSALRNLVTAQEKYWSDHGTYTTDVSALGFYPAPKGTRPPFLPQVIFAGGRGWSGITVHRRLNKSCVIFVGNPDEQPFVPRTKRDRLVASEEGAPTCERP